MPRILFLDDDPERHAIIRRRVGDENVVCTDNVEEWAQHVRTGRFDEFWFDHDLNDWATNVDWTGYKITGHDAAQWFSEFVKLEGLKIVVHSWNDWGAARIAETLERHNPVVEPFSLLLPCEVCQKCLVWLRDSKDFTCLGCNRWCLDCGGKMVTTWTSRMTVDKVICEDCGT